MANTTVLEWNDKAHPWVLKIEIRYEGKDTHGLPNPEDSHLMNAFEEELNTILIDTEGYLNIGRETADNLREILHAENSEIPLGLLMKLSPNIPTN
jgi:hypothetical protein